HYLYIGHDRSAQGRAAWTPHPPRSRPVLPAVLRLRATRRGGVLDARGLGLDRRIVRPPLSGAALWGSGRRPGDGKVRSTAGVASDGPPRRHPHLPPPHGAEDGDAASASLATRSAAAGEHVRRRTRQPGDRGMATT